MKTVWLVLIVVTTSTSLGAQWLNLWLQRSMRSRSWSPSVCNWSPLTSSSNLFVGKTKGLCAHRWQGV
jgi:hypothetical protein